MRSAYPPLPTFLASLAGSTGSQAYVLDNGVCPTQIKESWSVGSQHFICGCHAPIAQGLHALPRDPVPRMVENRVCSNILP